MCKSSKTTTNNQPPAWLQQAMQSFLGQAQGLIGKDTDPSKLVAPFNQEQQTAFGNIDALSGHDFSQSDVDKYMSPYMSDVINATEGQLNLQDAQQQNSLKGNIVSSGAYGGDRSAVLQSQLAGQQDMANNATIANLYNTGYGQALNEYNQQQQFGLGAAEAQLGAGTMQQQNAQQVLDVPYQQLDFLGQLFGNLGGLFGGTSTQKGSQGFSFAKGGSIRDAGRFDDGGVTRNIFMPFGGGTGGTGGHVSTMPKGGGGEPQQQDGIAHDIGDVSSLNTGLKGLGVHGGISGAFDQGADALGLGNGLSNAIAASPTQIPMAAAGDAAASAGMGIPLAAAGDAAAGTAAAGTAAAGSAAAAGSGMGIADLLALFALKDGGKTPKRSMGGGGLMGIVGLNGLSGLAPLPKMIQKLDDGGDVQNDVVDDNGNLVPLSDGAMTQDQTPPQWQGIATHYAPGQVPMADAGDDVGGQPAGLNTPMWSDGTPVIKDAGISAAAQQPATGQQTGLQAGYYGKRPSPSPWMSVATGVLGALANRSLSKGALEGLQEYQRESDVEENPVVDHTSGPTVHIRYGGPNGQDFDTGIPTQGALQAKAIADYRNEMIQTREDQVAQRTAAATQASQDREAAAHKPVVVGGNLVDPSTGSVVYSATGSTAEPGTTSLADFATRMGGAENATGNPAAKNPLSSATGNGQFIDSTWLQTARSALPQLANVPDAQLLAMRALPGFSHDMTAVLAQQNGSALEQAGIPATTLSLGLAHRFGAQGAETVLRADPSTQIAALFPPNVLAANPDLKGKTVGQYTQQLGAKIGNDPVAIPGVPNVSKGTLGNPQMVQVDDGQGGTRQIVAQQNKQTGQWVTADQNRTPVNPAGMALGSGAGGMGNRAEVYFARVSSAGNEAAAAARNIMELPTTASRGIFGGRQQGPSLFDAAKEDLTNQMTSQEVQDYNTMIAGVSRNLSTIESAGLSPSGSLTHSMDSIILKDGDTELTKMRKMAEFRQIVEKGLEPNLSNPRIPTQQKTLVQGIIRQMQQAIPFTHHDITMLEQSTNPQASLKDYAGKSNLGTAAQPAKGSPSQKFNEGQIYRDKNGNRARYQGGKFTAVP